MLSAIDCPGPNTVFNIATTSGFYAQMTGLLAGFALAAMVMLLTPTQVDERASSGKGRDNGVFLVLLAAFVALIITTLTYSVLAGESNARGRAATEELVDGLPFGLAVIMLFHGVTLLMQGGGVERKAVWTGRTVSAVAVPVLTLFYLTNGATDTESARAALKSGTCPPAGLLSIGVGLSGILAILLSIALIPKALPRRWRTSNWAQNHQHLVPIVVLAVAVLSAVTAGDLSTRTADFLLPSWAVTTYLIGVFLLLAALGVLLAYGYRATDHESATAVPESALVSPPAQS